MVLSNEDQKILRSFLSYMTARKTALRKALKFRTPLSEDNWLDMRNHYSNYFINLISAVDLIFEQKKFKGEDLQKKLYSQFSFEDFPDGKSNYLYIHEIRNAIVHRGLDITEETHIKNNFVLIIAPEKISNQSGKKSYKSFGKYLLDIIKKCEDIICSIMSAFLDENGIFESEIDTKSSEEEYKLSIDQNKVMPEPIKKLAQQIRIKPEWILEGHQYLIKNIKDALKPFEIRDADLQ
ncbi:hypothetical protein FBY51_1255 [Zymomonas mobilis]|uniref:hypothetical protein n=1 Tax=Zymomonas mobilis TaxID=542 RepID=UPI00026D8351|nr:hypothetical protein [Zymomonas mobilis]AFN55982.1 hypothetical protein ZZ6_0077 [Zymomonas mobilis subsp. mobilis ATCC 29191]TQK78587.1 hypothetical protein FBY53_1273 [Zymomonas mobilis]TQL16208.1 hypothetical protein FBY51_1255 [Zymomonas mobilis]GEB87019.1 hypothetical protein ZMO01_03590 [Zymomonas mobilis subsp. mobilis]